MNVNMHSLGTSILMCMRMFMCKSGRWEENTPSLVKKGRVLGRMNYNTIEEKGRLILMVQGFEIPLPGGGVNK